MNFLRCYCQIELLWSQYYYNPRESHFRHNAHDLSLKTWCWLHNHESKRVSSEAIPIYKSPVHFEMYQYFSIQKETAYLRWHPIPGPEKRKFKPKYPCGECRRTIRRNQDTILCARCNILSHTNCLKLSKSSLNYNQQHPERDWVCSLCSLPDYNESFLNNSTVDTNLTATDLLSTAENMQVDIRQLRGNNKKEWIIANLNIKSECL